MQWLHEPGKVLTEGWDRRPTEPDSGHMVRTEAFDEVVP